MPSSASSLVVSLRESLNARAAGFWRVLPDRLDQLAFSAAPDMLPAVALEFATATQSVPLDNPSLGIVQAATLRRTAVSIADQLPQDQGSGFWLRAFGAACSIAVPIEQGGVLLGVLSVALPDLRDPQLIEAALRARFDEVAQH
jgi:hypothetical protein